MKVISDLRQVSGKNKDLCQKAASALCDWRDKYKSMHSRAMRVEENCKTKDRTIEILQKRVEDLEKAS